MRILIFRGGALGDFIVTMPALRLLRQRWPGAKIEFVGNAVAGELGRLAGYLDAVHSQHEARWSALYAAEPLPSEFARWLGEFDVVINFWPDPERELARHFVANGTTFISSHARVAASPAAAHFCDALAPLGITAGTGDYVVRWAPPAALHADVDARLGSLREFVALHPGSGSPRKNWPLERWRAVVEKLGRPVLLVAGESDVLPAWADGVGLVAQNWPLPVLAAVLSRCRLFLGHDTGVSHLAALVGAPCVLLFGPTDPAVWAPPGPNVRTLKSGDTLEALSVAAVSAATEHLLSSPRSATI